MGSSTAANLWVLLGLGIAGILMVTKKLREAVKADFGAFIERLQLLPPPQPAPPKAPHPLTGLTFAVSDVFNIEGHVASFGNPDWLKTHETAGRTCAVVAALVDGGATCIGKTVVDDMALSLNGENKHYDTPTNPAAKGRVPGGSSSGSAVAVAAKLVDFSLGIDTDGGVRVPAGYCGILGFRPSQGTVSLSGVLPVSTSLDTVGWLAKDPSVLRLVGHVLLQVPFAMQRKPRNVVIADDYFRLSKVPADRVTNVVIKSIEKLYGKQVLRHVNLVDYISTNVRSLNSLSAKLSNGNEPTSRITLLANVLQALKRHEFSQNHNEWIVSAKPSLSPTTSRQVPEIVVLSDTDIEKYHAIRSELRSAINGLLKDGGILVIPTSIGPPPKVGAKENLSEDYLIRTSTFPSLASLSGCCQVSVPLGFHEKLPVSISLLARHGGDRFLLDTLQTVHASLLEHSNEIEKSKSSESSNKAVSPETLAEMAKERGNQAYKEKLWVKAIGCYTEAIKLNNRNATYYNNRAQAHLGMGSFHQAIADCTEAINLDKKNVKAYFRRGTAREMLSYYDDATQDFRHALVLEPNNKRAAESLERLRKLFP